MLHEIAVRSPLRKLFTYESDEALPRGVRVRIPFGSREVIGFVWNEAKDAPKGLKKIIEVIDEAPLFDELTLRFYEISAQYYGISLGELLSSSFPSKVREGKVLPSFPIKHFVPVLPELSAKQLEVFQKILQTGDFHTHLLLGETGSGKTEIYLRLIEKILFEGGQSLLLVPEISLTPQLEDRLSARLGARVSIFHSALSEKKREEAFARALQGEADVFLGARSALFLPFKNLKLLLVDEEHDNSYKQSERAPYNARDLAILRAQLFNTPVVLGSATPSLESYERSKLIKNSLYHLPTFYESPAPRLEIIDLKECWKEEAKSFITRRLHECISSKLENREQILLFLNRRGSAAQRLCVSCGSVDECKNCSVTLTIHEDLRSAVCHWCGYQKPLKPKCDVCGEREFFCGGIGTKEVESQIRFRFPEARVARLDRDQTTKRETLPNLLRDFAAGKIDILIGTQMISKGMDIPKLSLVGVILADQGWSVPDFRATERAFQLMKQLMGRGGRRGQASDFLVQTFIPQHPLFEWLKLPNAYDVFAEEELKIRKMADLPPYAKLCLLTFGHRREDLVLKEAEVFAKRLQAIANTLGLTIVGPTPAPIHRWKGVFRIQILVKGIPKAQWGTFMATALNDWDLQSYSSKLRIDRDPYHFM